MSRILQVSVVLVCLITATASAADLPETGPRCDALKNFDCLMRSFVGNNEIPGAALAVASKGRLVFARGYGFADVEQGAPVRPDSLFRIASLSKPITAMAVLQLVQKGRLDLDQPAVDVLRCRACWATSCCADERLCRITLRQLLQHRGGWDRERSIDPMFRCVEIAASLGKQPPAEAEDVVRFMLGWQLDFEPGARYAYSNFGYCLLGRVIESVTASNYETHVRKNLLEPLGITEMRVGRTLPHGRRSKEVRYYAPDGQTGIGVVGRSFGRQVPRPYGAWYLEAMDAHGGWVASAIDLVRFGVQVQRAERRGWLEEGLWRQMTARPPGRAGHECDGTPKSTWYGLGWQVRPVGKQGSANLWHIGSLPGTSAILVLRHDGLCWAALFNTSRTADGKKPASKIDPLLHQVADGVEQWPAHDLFEPLTADGDNGG